MKYSTDRTVSLIYFWLKANKLPKTCQSLEEEYGKEIKDLKGVNYSLRKVLGVYEAMSVLLNSFVTPEKNKETATISATRRRKISGSTDVDSSTTAKKKLAGSTVVDGTIQKSPVIKKKKEPVFLPGVWNCPESENALNNVYERNRKSISLPISDDNKQNGHASPQSSPSSPSLLLPSSPSLLSVGDTLEVEEVNLPLPTVANEEEGAHNIGNFTSDSESDSNDDAPSVKKAVELCNSIVSESPIKPLKAKSVTELSSLSKEKSTVDRLVAKPNANDETDKLMTHDEEDSKKKKKRKKSKHLLPMNSTIYEGSNSVDVDNDKLMIKEIEVGTSNNIGKDLEIPLYTKIKKKRKRSSSEDVEPKKKTTSEVLGECPVDETSHSVEAVIKKKKKKKSKHPDVNAIDEQKSMENSNLQTPETVEMEPKKKKKKSKIVEIENSITDVLDTKSKKVALSEAVNNDSILSNLGDSLKKRKKKKHIDIGA